MPHFLVPLDHWPLSAALWCSWCGVSVWSNLTLVLAILTLCAMHAVIAVLPSGFQFLIYMDTPAYIPLVNLGYIYLFAMLVQFVGDRGVKPAIFATLAIFAAIPLTLAKMKAHRAQLAIHLW